MKVNTADIVNNVTSGGTTVPLSAEQGKALNTNKAEKTKMFYPDNVYGGIITANFNTIAVSGSYTGFGTATGAPTTSQSWFIRHINSNSGTTAAYQEAIGYTDGAFYTRRKVSGVWNDWVLKTKMLDNRDWTTHDILLSVTADGYPALKIL